MKTRIGIGTVITMIMLGSLCISSILAATSFAAESARAMACEAHKEAKRYLDRDKFLDQAGGDPAAAAILICISRGHTALEKRCEAQEEKILTQQIRQVEGAITKDCR